MVSITDNRDLRRGALDRRRVCRSPANVSVGVIDGPRRGQDRCLVCPDKPTSLAWPFRKVPTGDINRRDCDVRSLAEPETQSTGFRQVQALVAQGRRALGRNHLRHNRRNPPSIYAHRMRQLFPKLTLCPIPKTSCSSLRPARARLAVRRRGPLRPHPLRRHPLRLH